MPNLSSFSLGPFFGWDESFLTARWLSGLRVMADQLQQGAALEQVQSVRLPGELYQQPTLAKPEAGVICKLKGGGGFAGGGAMALETPEESRQGLDPWGFSPPQSDQLLDWERIMANKRVGTYEMRMRLETGEVEPMHLGVTLSDFTEWAFPYILIMDEDTNWATWHEIEGCERVCHTDELEAFEKRSVHFLITKPLQKAQTYPAPPPPSAAYHTVSLPVWQDAYRLLDTVGFLDDDFCTPLGVYVTFAAWGERV